MRPPPVPAPSAALPIRRRILLRADGTVLVHRITHCVRRMRTVGADVCAGCPEFAGTGRSDAGQAWVVCRERGAIAAAALREREGALADRVPVHLCTARTVTCVEQSVDREKRAAFLSKHHGALLVDERGRPVGHLSSSGELEALAGPVHELVPLARAAAVLALEERERLAIVDVEGVAIGLLTARDVLRWLASGAGYLVPDGSAV